MRSSYLDTKHPSKYPVAIGRILEYAWNSETRVKLLGDPMKMCVT